MSTFRLTSERNIWTCWCEKGHEDDKGLVHLPNEERLVEK